MPGTTARLAGLAVDRGCGARQGRAVEGVPLDALISRMLSRSPFDYRVAADDSEREVAYRLRGSAVIDSGWWPAGDLPGGMERDEYDDRAIQVIGWDGAVAMSTGRVVLPPGLPTEDACGIVVEPRGEVVDVGRMCVARTHQSLEHAAFIGLMCRLYLAMRERGFRVACGMMSAPARCPDAPASASAGDTRPGTEYWNELRAPVRFGLMSATRLLDEAQDRLADPQAARTSAVFAPPKPNEFDSAQPGARGRGCPGRRRCRAPGRWCAGRRPAGPAAARSEIRLTIASTAPDPPIM